MEDYEIRVNGNVVAICIKDVVRLFTDALINVIGDEFELTVRKRVADNVQASVNTSSTEQ